MMDKSYFRSPVFLWLLMVFFGLPGLPGWAAELPRKGDTLPALTLQAPAEAAGKGYLGLRGDSFRLAEVPCDLLLLEVLGVYCPQCYKQAPLFNSLFNRIEKGKLRGRVKMLGLAAGGNPAEIAYLQQQGQYRFPVVPDADFAAHKSLGEPRTPFTLLIDAKGNVLHTHMGVIEDIDALYRLITALLP